MRNLSGAGRLKPASSSPCHAAAVYRRSPVAVACRRTAWRGRRGGWCCLASTPSMANVCRHGCTRMRTALSAVGHWSSVDSWSRVIGARRVVRAVCVCVRVLSIII